MIFNVSPSNYSPGNRAHDVRDARDASNARVPQAEGGSPYVRQDTSNQNQAGKLCHLTRQ